MNLLQVLFETVTLHVSFFFIFIYKTACRSRHKHSSCLTKKKEKTKKKENGKRRISLHSRTTSIWMNCVTTCITFSYFWNCTTTKNWPFSKAWMEIRLFLWPLDCVFVSPVRWPGVDRVRTYKQSGDFLKCLWAYLKPFHSWFPSFSLIHFFFTL